jgi:hypothetical protein
MLAKIYAAVGALMLAGFITMNALGWEPAAEQQKVLPPSLRQSPGGYRSFHIWHSGFRGGK